MPAQWVLAARPAGDDSFYFKAQPESRATAQLQVTLIDTRPERPIVVAQLREELRKLVQSALAESVEKEFAPQELRLPWGPGWVVQLTDANLVGKPPAPEDFKIMRSALLCLDDHALVHVTMNFERPQEPDPAAMLELLTSLRFARTAQNGELASTQVAGHFEFTAPDSRLRMRIPADGWVQDMDKISGSLTHSLSFILSREKPNLILRGWFEPAQRCTSLQDFFASEAATRKEAGLPAPQNPEFLKIGNWEIATYDLPFPEADGTDRHLRAQLTRAGTWIDLHLSSTSQLTATEVREQLLATLQSIQVREAAKLLALVHWAQARGVKLVPPGPPANPQPLPASFQRGFWTASFYAGSDKYFFGLGASGGVDFGRKIGYDWVQAREDSALGGTALQQLAGSAALAQQAAAAAESGDLESARSLADQSARAMTGDFDFTGHPALGKIPEVPPPERVAFVEFQNELVIQNQHAISTLSSNPAGSPQHAQAKEHVRQIQNLLAAGPQPPAETKHWVKLLRDGDWASLPAPAKPTATVAVTPPPALKPVKPVVDPVERARMRDEITQLRTELCRIQVQLRRFNKTIQSDEDQRAQWEKVTNDAYESALGRAKEKFEEFSVDFPGDILKEKLETVTDPAERAKIERALRLVDRFKDAYTTRDFSTWAAQEEFTRQEIIEGIKQIADICGVEDRIKEYFSKKWGLKRAFAFYDAADDLITSAYDVTAEVVAWDRLKQLNRNSDDFLKATEASGRRLRVVMEGIRQREIRLGLDPGSTKEPCAQ